MPLRSVHKPPIARIKTGSYTGDGKTSQAITGVGFKPKELFIVRKLTAALGAQWGFYANDQMTTNVSDWHLAGYYEGKPDAIKSLDADGFTVGVSNVAQNPNVNGQVYVYVAFG